MELPKGEFFQKVLLDGIRDILAAQRKIAQHRIYQHGKSRISIKGTGSTIKGRSGALMASLNQVPRVERLGDGVRSSLTYPVYIRFLDMKKHGNYKIYNRQIWGILYNEIIPRMKYEYSAEVRAWIKDEMERIMNSNNNISI